MAVEDLDKVLQLIGFGPRQFLSVITCCLALIFVASNMVCYSVLSLSIGCEFMFKSGEVAILVSSAFVGCLLTGPYAGYKTDLVGRRKTCLYSLAFSLLGSIGSALMPNFVLLVIFRLLTGLFLTAVYVSSLTYLMEYTKTSLRPMFSNSVNYCSGLGCIFVPLTAHLFFPLRNHAISIMSFQMRRWRICALMIAIPGILAFIGMLFLPESAKWFLSKGQNQSAYETLDRLFVKNKKKDLKSIGVTDVTQSRLYEGGELTSCARITSLFKAPLGRPYMCNCLILGILYFVGQSFVVSHTKIRNLIPYPSIGTICHILEDKAHKSPEAYCIERNASYQDSLLLGGCILVMAILINLLLLCFNRRTLTVTFCFLSSFFGFLLNLLKYHYRQLAAMEIFIVAVSSSCPLVLSSIVDCLPTHLRGLGISLSVTLGRMMIIVSNTLIDHLIYKFCFIVWNSYAALIFCNAILAYFLQT